MGTWGGQGRYLCVVDYPHSDLNAVYRYCYQLGAFIDNLRSRIPEHWYDAQDSITNMEWIEAIYKEVSRPILPWQSNLGLTAVLSRPAWDPVQRRWLR